MAYTKPGVTVTQKQVTQSFPLGEPTLKSCVVGPGYFYLDPFKDEAVYDADYVGDELTLSGESISGKLPEYGDYIENSISIELLGKKGAEIGKVKYLENTDFTVSGEDITINANIPGYTGADDVASVRVSFLAEQPKVVDEFIQISNTKKLNTLFGSTKSINPLAYGAVLASAGGSINTNIVGVAPAAGSESFSNSKSVLELHDVYTIAPMTSDAGEAGSFQTYVEDMSKPENKKESLAITSSQTITDYSGSRDDIALSLQSFAAGIGSRRFVSIYPQAGWIDENRHLSTLSQSYLQAVYGASFNLLPKFKNDTEVTVGEVTYSYEAGEEITAAALNNLKNSKNKDFSFMDVYAPIPGYFFAAALAGQIAVKRPETPLTRRGFNGAFHSLYKSNDFFTESRLDKIAEGGNWILVSKGPFAIENRHQLSTNALTIETRELSITTQLDYAAKYLRDIATPLIGKFVISDNFITNLTSTLNGAAEGLVERGYIRGLKILSVNQDEIEPDNISVDVEATVFYPVNKIKFTITF